MDISTLVDKLSSLKDGWLEGAGKAPSAAGLSRLADAFQAHYPEDLPLPRLYPTPQGGLQAEWSFGAIDLSLEIDLEHQRGQWHTLNMDTQVEETRELALDQGEDWQWLVEQITKHSART